MNDKEINLNNPIMVCYLNVGNLSRQRAQEQIYSFMEHASYPNLSMIILPVKDQQESKIEIIWKGLDVEKSQISNDRITFLQQKMETLIEIISEDITDESVKQKLRDFSLNRILDE